MFLMTGRRAGCCEAARIVRLWALGFVLLGVLGAVGAAGTARADATTDALDAALRLESRGLALLVEQQQFERSLLTQDPERLIVFVTAAPGAQTGLDEATLYLDGKVVVRHRYAPNDLARFSEGGAQALYVGSVVPGEHTLRLELRLKQGKTQPMPVFRFVKRGGPRVVELEIAGDATRQVRAASW